tara:strand:+ start:3508 stop:4059 length:552 start_codon:yes stop_codon:yes gene_type:complete
MITSIEINRGTGAGGANTNTSGLPFEEQTDLSNYHTILEINQHSKTIKFLNHETLFRYTKQKNFEKYMGDKINFTIKALHGSKRPDEAYINEEKKIVFIIEKKNQNTSGSKCECIQTAVNKRRNLNRRIPDYHVVYIYCLSSWFKTNCEAEIEDLQEDSIPVFWGNEDTYKTDIINFMVNYIS